MNGRMNNNPSKMAANKTESIKISNIYELPNVSG